MFEKSPRESLLVYPEGHRMYEADSVAISAVKTGMIRVSLGLCSTPIPGKYLSSSE